MRIPRIFTDQALAEGSEIVLEQNAARHLVSVLRLGPSDTLTLFNGKGGEYNARLITADTKKTSALLESFCSGIEPSPLAITLAIGLAKGDRMDWLVQKAVELGVAEIIPLFTERCEVKLKAERATKKLRHWQEIARSACEQSGQNLIPTISHPTNLQQLTIPETSFKVILDPLAHTSLLSHITDHCTTTNTASPKSALVLSGPEGGLTAEEIAFVGNKGVLPVSLGPRVLRAETAPLAALSLLQAHWGDWP